MSKLKEEIEKYYSFEKPYTEQDVNHRHLINLLSNRVNELEVQNKRVLEFAKDLHWEKELSLSRGLDMSPLHVETFILKVIEILTGENAWVFLNIKEDDKKGG